MKKKQLKNIVKYLTIAVVVLATVAATLLNNVSPVFATTKVSDASTTEKYTASLGDNYSTDYAGRVWTDKSVFTDSTTIDGASIAIADNEDFLVSFSALATSQSITGQTKAPLDVVFIIDLSNSMDEEMDNGESRLYNTIVALNDSIEKLMENEHARVAVAAYGSTAATLLPLGHYEKTTYYGSERDFFTLSNNEGSISIRAKNTTTNRDYSTSVSLGSYGDIGGATNIQMGFYQGMNILANETSVTATIDDKEIKRIPSIVLLSDGAPTVSSNDNEWWAPANNDDDGPGSSFWFGNGMKAMLTAAYMKDRIDARYGKDGVTKIYTIGMGIDELESGFYYDGDSYIRDPKGLAQVVLNPQQYKNSTSQHAVEILNAWNTYSTQNKTQTVSIKVNGSMSYRNNRWYETNLDYYSVSHPTTDIDSLYEYVDYHYHADNASAVDQVFEDIVNNITISSPEVPTQTSSTESMTEDGWITYTDPLGEYMEVKDVKVIIHNGIEYANPTVSTVDGNKVYTFTQDAETAIHGTQNLSHIDIHVEQTTATQQTVVIRIPAALIPLRVNTVALDDNGQVKTHEHNNYKPIRVVYGVGLVDGAVDENGVINTDVVSEEYVVNNSNEDGTANFYTNAFSGSKLGTDGQTVGDAVVEFEPSTSNPFYYIQDSSYEYYDYALYESYSNGVFSNPVTSLPLEDGKTYYYKHTYYHGNSVEEKAIVRTGAELSLVELEEVNGKVVRKEGTPRINRIKEFDGSKSTNTTNTATEFYSANFIETPTNEDPYDGYFRVYLGNNGVLSAKTNGTLEITKTVTVGEGLTIDTDKEFTFTITLTGVEANDTFPMVTYDSEGNELNEVEISTGDTFKLKHAQSARIRNLPHGANYTVTEASEAGYTTTSTNATGTIEASSVKTAAFINNYTVASTVYPTDGSIDGKKVLTGRDWINGEDQYTFVLTPYNDAPIPTSGNSITVTTANNNEAAFSFGQITYSQPGVYRYTIYESEPENANQVAGITYSSALYRLVVTVTDNGDGTLSAVSDVQQLYADNATALFTYDSDNNIVVNDEKQDEIVFTNSYTPKEVVRVPVAIKDYTDLSGTKPLVSGMFEFEMGPVGIIEAGKVVENTASKLPMPEGQSDKVVATNEGHNVTFLPITFEYDENETYPITYRYYMKEVIPANPVKGMTYEESEYHIDITVDYDETTGELIVNAQYPNTERVISFKNVYKPAPVEELFNITKVLEGRDWTEDDIFTFTITPVGTTVDAIANGDVILPNNTQISIEDYYTDHTASYGNIIFNKVGTYTFEVKEEKGNSSAITYDSSVQTVTFVITDGFYEEADDEDGQLFSQAFYSNQQYSTIFTNTYTSTFDDDTAVTITATKSLTGREIRDGEFFIQVYEEGHEDDYVLYPIDADGSIVIFDNVTYTREDVGVHTYIVKEQIPSDAIQVGDEFIKNGVSYDTTEHKVVITVSEDIQTGIISASWTINGQASSNIQVNNTYGAAEVVIVPYTFTKVVTGNDYTLKEGEFTFKKTLVSALDADGNDITDGIIFGQKVGVVGETLFDTTTNNADGTVRFDNVTFTKAGIYKVKIEEVVPEGATAIQNSDGTVSYMKDGIIYDQKVIESTFEVTDDGNGQLKAVRTNTFQNREFKNEYTSTGKVDGETYLEVEKQFTGRINDDATNVNNWLSTDQFTFTLQANPNHEATRLAVDNGDIVLPDITEIDIDIINQPDRKEAFGDIIINKPGTYEFMVREESSDEYKIPGVVLDTTPRIVVVEATENDELNGELNITVTYKDQLSLVFKNKYSPEEDILVGHDSLWVTKEIQNREWNANDSFTFTLEANDDATKAAVEAGDIVIDSSTLTITDPNGGNHFGDITFKKPGQYTFIVKEVIPSDAVNNVKDGITYDTTEKVVVINVVDNAVGGLSASLDSTSQALKFTNVYKTEKTTLTGFEITKVFEGRPTWQPEDSFTFKLEPHSENAIEYVKSGDIVLGNDEVVINDQNNPKATFGDIVFLKPGSFTFAISEVAGTNANITYDSHVLYVTVYVKDNQAGELVVENATPSYSGETVFTNTYNPSAITVTLEGTKVMDGRDLIDSDYFDFTIASTDESNPLPDILTVTNDQDGKIKFAPITFTAEGTYTYTITETGGKAFGVTNDTGSVQATVVIGKNDKGELVHTSTTYQKVNPVGNETEFTFVNTYTTTPTDPITITAVKEVYVAAGSYELDEKDFSFTVTPHATNPSSDPIKQEMAGTNILNGSMIDVILLDNIEFTEEGVYQYTIQEENTEVKSMHYDSSVYTVKVTVTDDEENAKLKAKVEITKTKDNNVTTVDAISFNNRYEPGSTSLGFSATKALENLAFDKAPTFQFKLTGYDGAPMPEGSTSIVEDNPEVADEETSYITTTNQETVINFGNISYSDVGTYKYVITEINEGPKDGITYDSTSYTVTVTVVDDEGELKATATGLENITFTNTYATQPATFNTEVLAVSKALDGRVMEAGEFTFELKDASGNVVATATNDETGKVAFDEDIELDEIGTYYYTLTEKASDTYDGVEYDQASYTVVVVVDDVTFKGQLEVTSVTIVKENTTVQTATFSNTYTPKETSVTVGITKTLEGRSMKEDEFEFEIIDEQDTVVSKGTNDANGIVLFESIPYTEAGEYTYTIREVQGSAGGVTYDESTYQFKVVVEDDLEGYLKATVTDLEGQAVEVEFVNTYEAAPTTIDIPALKAIVGEEGYTMKANDFTFVLTDHNGVEYTATNAEDGSIVFEDVAFNEVGSYQATISETKGNIEGITYDSTVHTITINVTDDLEGQLVAEMISEPVVFQNSYTPPVHNQTGDGAPIGLYIGVLGASALGLVAAVVARKRKEQE